MSDEIALSVDFTARVDAARGPLAKGSPMVYDSAAGAWVLSTAANRATANARTQAFALTVIGGSIIGTVSYQQAGVLAAALSGLGAGASQLVRVTSGGGLERIASYTAGDDVIGLAEADGRVHLFCGLPMTSGASGTFKTFSGIIPPSDAGITQGWGDQGFVEGGTPYGDLPLYINTTDRTLTRMNVNLQGTVTGELSAVTFDFCIGNTESPVVAFTTTFAVGEGGPRTISGTASLPDGYTYFLRTVTGPDGVVSDSLPFTVTIANA